MKTETERDFQEVATEHGKSCVEDCRQQLDVLACADNGQERLEELRAERAALVEALTDAEQTLASEIVGSTQGIAAKRRRRNEERSAAKQDLIAFDESEDGQELAKLESLADCDGFGDEDAARRIIDERPLSVEVRSDWIPAGDMSQSGHEPVEYCILLGTGGPASRIVGDLENCQPKNAIYQHQDWGKPWTAAQLSSDEEETLREWAAQFYFGD